jgi:type IV secretory pathway VirJ component
MMRKKFILTVVFTSILFSNSRAISPADSAIVAPFGKVYIYKQTNTPRNVVILISGDGGWKYGVLGFAETFSDMDNLVVGVDILRYYKELRQRTGDCYSVSADFVQLATVVEKKYNFPDYRPPVIMGYSSGATLVYGILAQARAGTYIGGISVGFCSDIELPKMLCQTNGLAEKNDVEGKSYFLLPDEKLGNPWVVLQGKLDKVCNYSEVEDFVSKTSNAELITLPDVRHGFSKWSNFMPQWKDAFDRLVENYDKSRPANANIEQVKTLPLVITNSKLQNKNAPIALIISGDGGWYGFEQSIADNLAKQGIPAIGLDSKKYFWKRRSPEETASDMAKALNFYGKEWNREKFLLIGYSLGAEIVPFIVTRMSEEMRTKILSEVLLSPEINTDFEIHILNMLGIGNRQNTYNVVDEINKVPVVPTLIIFGEGEKSKVPALLTGSAVKIRKIPGDHHYKFDAPLIIRTMKDNNAF